LVTLPLTVPPWIGVSIAPKGAVAFALSQTIVFVPSDVEFPSASSAIAWSRNVPLPRFGRKFVSIR